MKKKDCSVQEKVTKSSILAAASRIEEIRHQWKSKKLDGGVYPYEEIDQLSFPGGWEKGILLLQDKDPIAIENSIIFLEADPFFFRSGYIKERIIHTLKRITLSSEQKTRLQKIILDSFNKKYRREFGYYCRLAPSIASDDFIKKLECIREKIEQQSTKRYMHALLDAIKQRLKP